MSESIRRALEIRLAAMTPALDTAYENIPFTPVSGTPYQRANMLPANPDNPSQGGTHYLEIGIFQVSLFYPNDVGSATAQARADAVRVWFKRGTTLTHGGINTTVIATPAKAPAFNDGDRYVIPISIRYQANIFLT